MSTVLKLYSTQLKMRLRSFMQKLSFGSKGKKNYKSLLMLFVLLIAGFEIIGGYSYLIYKINELSPTPEVIISLSFVLAQLITLIFGLFFILGMMFFAKDSEFLASLPIEPWKVFSSKLMLVYTSEILVTLVFAAPPIIIYGTSTGSGIIFYIKALLIVLFLPFIPLAMASFLSLSLMGVVSKTRHRDKIALVAGVVLIIAIVVGQNLLTRYMTSSGFLESAEKLIQRSDGIVRIIGRAFPPSIWASVGVTSKTNALFNSAIFIIVSIAAFAVVILVSSKIYYAGALSHLEASKSKKSRKNTKLNFTVSSPSKAIFVREWKLLLRSTIYALNSLITIILGPVMIALFSFSSDSQMPSLTDYILPFIEDGRGLYVVFGLTLAGVLFAGINPAAATTISREGKNFWLSKTIPINAEVQVKAKFFAVLSISALTALTTITTVAILFKIPFLIAIQALVLATIITTALTCSNIIIDLLRPKLKWDTEQEAIKQNMNVILAMGAQILLLLVLGGVSALLFKLKASLIVNGAVVFVLSSIITLVLYQAVIKISQYAFDKIES